MNSSMNNMSRSNRHFYERVRATWLTLPMYENVLIDKKTDQQYVLVCKELIEKKEFEIWGFTLEFSLGEHMVQKVPVKQNTSNKT